ncbi:hypothetical protein [Microbacterium sp. 22296]|uniref:hypothetical protein n=1 Tax=Microbacterium sp. 22296 TaxID=3453903 RepID=UPI003F849320
MNRDVEENARDLAAGVWRCSSCGRTTPYSEPGTWAATRVMGIIVAIACDECQTPEQHLEAEVRAATVDYSIDAAGLIHETPKGETA